MNQTTSDKNKFIRNLIFSLIIFAFFTGTLELVLRTTHLFGAHISYSKPDSDLGWRYTPGMPYWNFKENDHPIEGRINNYGWRDNDWTIEKPENSYRIAVLGDSFIAAFEVELDKTFLKIAERSLNTNLNYKYELMNFGRSGSTQTEQLLVLKNEVMQFSPDMVVLFFFPGNDIRDIHKETAVHVNRPFYHVFDNGELRLDKDFLNKKSYKAKSFINLFKQNSALISLVAEKYNAYTVNRKIRTKRVQAAKSSSKSPAKIDGHLSLCTTSPDEIYLRNYKLNKILINAMSEYCKERGIPFMLGTLDIIPYLPEVEKVYISIDPSFDVNFFEDDLSDYARELNIEHLPLQRLFRKSYESSGLSLHWGDGGHWNYEGHKVAANALTNKFNSIRYINKSNISKK